MPRRREPPRLYLRERRGREAVWVIRDGGEEVSTGCSPGDRTGAEEALVRYIRSKHRPTFSDRDPSAVLVADVLNFYAQVHAPTTAHPDLIGYHLVPLILFFGSMTVGDVGGDECRGYVAARTIGKIGRKVSDATARREMETMGAAMRFAVKEKKLSHAPILTLPEKSPRRERWLQRWEAASLVAGALGWRVTACRVKDRRPDRWEKAGKPSYHVARFILIGLYTGTRHEAILGLGWRAKTDGGWFDLDSGVLYRRGDGERETNKRRTPAPIPDRLMPHLRRWEKKTKAGPVEYHGKRIKKLRTGFERARDLAGLDDDVTPHILRHTCATWLLRARVRPWEVAKYLGTTEKVIEATYGHHSPDFLQGAAKAFGRGA